MVDFTFAHREEGFDEHIEKSIRGYSQLMEDVVALSRYFVENGTTVVDIGCSTGKMTKALIDYNRDHIEGSGVDTSKFKRKNNSNVQFEDSDARYYQYENCSLITSIFTLQFMPKCDRKDTLEGIYEGLNEGGGFIFAEKTICENAQVQDMITFNYYDYKRKSFSTEDIMDKERELRHMMKPNTWKEIENMLMDVGFNVVQPFWRNHAFVGAVAIK